MSQAVEGNRFANEYAEIIADELNVKEVRFTIGYDESDRVIDIRYLHDTLGSNHMTLDIYIDGVPQNKQALAQTIFARAMHR